MGTAGSHCLHVSELSNVATLSLLFRLGNTMTQFNYRLANPPIYYKKKHSGFTKLIPNSHD